MWAYPTPTGTRAVNTLLQRGNSLIRPTQPTRTRHRDAEARLFAREESGLATQLNDFERVPPIELVGSGV